MSSRPCPDLGFSPCLRASVVGFAFPDSGDHVAQALVPVSDFRFSPCLSAFVVGFAFLIRSRPSPHPVLGFQNTYAIQSRGMTFISYF